MPLYLLFIMDHQGDWQIAHHGPSDHEFLFSSEQAADQHGALLRDRLQLRTFVVSRLSDRLTAVIEAGLATEAPVRNRSLTEG